LWGGAELVGTKGVTARFDLPAAASNKGLHNRDQFSPSLKNIPYLDRTWKAVSAARFAAANVLQEPPLNRVA
jgi:hypothetical protein